MRASALRAGRSGTLVAWIFAYFFKVKQTRQNPKPSSLFEPSRGSQSTGTNSIDGGTHKTKCHRPPCSFFLFGDAQSWFSNGLPRLHIIVSNKQTRSSSKCALTRQILCGKCKTAGRSSHGIVSVGQILRQCVVESHIPTLFARTKSRDGTENDFRKESYYSTYESRRRKWRCKIEYYGVRCSHFQICLSVLQDNTFPNCESEEISLGLPASRDSTYYQVQLQIPR